MEQPQAPSDVTSNNPDNSPSEEQQEESAPSESGHFDPETGNLVDEPLDDDFNDRAEGQVDGEAADNA